MNTDTIKINKGIGKGGAYWCQNISPAREDGVFAGLSSVNKAVRTASSTTSSLGIIRKFLQTGSINNVNSIIWGLDAAGDLYHSDYTGGNFIRVVDSAQTQGQARGMIIDSNNQVTYTNSRYVARMYDTTLDGNITIDASSVVLTDASDFPTAGYAFIKDGFVGEVIQWTGKTSNTLTGVTRGEDNTTATAHTSGKIVYYVDEDWKDFGASLATNYRPAIRWEGWNLFGNNYRVDGYSTSDGSDWTAAGTARISLPIDRTIIDFGLLPTSATSYVIIGANSGGNGYLYVWDGADTQAISERELVGENITCIEDNYVATDNAIYRYDGSNLELICTLPDVGKIKKGVQISVYSMDIGNGYLYFTSNCNQLNRNKSGVWVCDLSTKELYYILPSHYSTYETIFGGIFVTSIATLVGNNFSNGSVDSIVELPSTRGSTYQFIYSPTNAKVLQLKGLKINISTDLVNYYNNKNLDFDIIVRGYDFTRPYIQYQQLKTGETPSGSSQFIISSSLGLPQVGDKVDIIRRDSSTTVNSTMASRNITAITAGTSKYTIDVDDDFPVAINLATQNNAPIVLSYPLKKLGVGKISVEDTKLNLDGYKIQLLDQPRFKKMMFEIEIRCGDITIAPELNSLEINYEILE